MIETDCKLIPLDMYSGECADIISDNFSHLTQTYKRLDDDILKITLIVSPKKTYDSIVALTNLKASGEKFTLLAISPDANAAKSAQFWHNAKVIDICSIGTERFSSIEITATYDDYRVETNPSRGIQTLYENIIKIERLKRIKKENGIYKTICRSIRSLFG